MLRDKIQNFDVGMFEQNVIAYLVMEQPKLLDHIHFEGNYCFNCWQGFSSVKTYITECMMM